MDTLDPHEQLDIGVGNALRVANNRFTQAAKRFKPYTIMDEMMEDICALNDELWMDLR